MSAESWNERWGRDDFAPFWLSDHIPAPVIRALETGLFGQGEPLLEIGCGSGRLAAHLADRGLRVTAIDIAQTAISRAQLRFSRSDGMLTYLVRDITDAKADIAPANGAIDCGCFHGIPPNASALYASNLSRCLISGGHFLLMHKTASANLERQLSDRDVRLNILQYFERDFELISQTKMMFGAEAHQIPGLSFVFLRRNAL